MRSKQEILKKVHVLEIKSKKLARELFTGEYHSAFKGRGMSFKEVREYTPGDDIRFIDWNVSARFGHPYSKLFEEERELTVMLLIDISNSSLFGTVYGRKRDTATELAAVLAFSAVANNDKVGAIFFSNKIELFIPPKKGKQHALYIIRQMLALETTSNGTDIGGALQYFSTMIKRSSIVVVLSDFLDTNYDDALRIASKKHDMIGVKIYDQMDMQMPDAGLLLAIDAETNRETWIDSSSPYVRQKYSDGFFEATAQAASSFRKAGSDLLHIKTGDDHVYVLQRFFKSRARKV